MSVLLLEKINHKFKTMTGSKQSSGLSVCLGMIAESISKVTLIPVDNFDHVKLAVQRFKPKKVIVEALWMSVDNFKLLKNQFPNVKFYVHIHSNIPFLSSEPHSFETFRVLKEIGVGLIFNDYRSASAFPESIHLPNIYSGKMHPIKHSSDPNIINVICAGSMRAMKNHSVQALAAIMYADSLGKKLRFHCNLNRFEGENMTPALVAIFKMHPKHELVSIPWMNHKEFVEFLTTMHMGMQVSLSESFNIVAADYVAAGIPMVVSEEIEWADSECWVPTGDPKIISLIMNRVKYSVENNRSSLSIHNHEAIKKWENFCDS